MKISLSDHFTYRKLMRFTLPSIVMIFLMRRYIGPEAIAGGFKMK